MLIYSNICIHTYTFILSRNAVALDVVIYAIVSIAKKAIYSNYIINKRFDIKTTYVLRPESRALLLILIHSKTKKLMNEWRNK